MTTDSRPARRAALLAAIVVAVVALLLLRWITGGRDSEPYQEEIHPARTGVRAPAAAPAPAAKPANPVAGGAAEAGAAESKPPDLLRVKTNVPGALVTVRYAHVGGEPEPEPDTAKCDAGGEATFLVPGHEDLLAMATAEAKAAGFAPAEGSVHWDEREIRLTLRPPVAVEEAPPAAVGLDVSGKVTFPDGRPARGAEIEAETVGGWRIAEVGGDGEYVLTRLARGPVTVKCPQTGEERRVEAGSSGVDFKIGEHLVFIRLVDGKGRHFRYGQWDYQVWKDGAMVDNGGVAGIGDSEGMVVHVPVGGTLKVGPRAPGCPNIVTSFSPEGAPAFHDLPIVVEKIRNPGAVAVRIRTDSGDPPAKVYLIVKNEMGGVVGHVGIEGEVKTTAEGAVLLEGLPAGRFVVEFNTMERNYSTVPKDYGLPTSAEVFVEAGKTVPVDLIVPLGGKIALTVRGQDGAVVAPENLRVRDERGEEVETRFWIRGKDGTKSSPPRSAAVAYIDDPLPPGRYTIEVLRDGDVVGSKAVAVPRGETLEVEIRLDR